MNQSGTRPNIIVILVDDMGYSDLGFMGSEIKTPNLDRMAFNGQVYTSMYNCGRCCPTRASLLTGLYPHKAGVGHMTGDYGTPAYQGFLRNDSVTIAEVLHPQGYQTLMSGKWHVGGPYSPREADLWTPGEIGNPTPRQRGFDRYFGTIDGAGSFFTPHHLMEDDSRIEVIGDDFYMTDAVTSKAVDMINDAAARPQPFFLYLAYTAPHWPLHALPEDIARYEGKYTNGWDSIRTSRHEEMLARGILEHNWDISPRDPHAIPWQASRLQDWEDSRMAVYAAMVDRMDQGVGQVLATLESLDIGDDTLILFLSDNGGCAEFLSEDGWATDYPLRAVEGVAPNPGNITDLRPGTPNTFMSYELPWANVSNAPFRMHKSWVHEGGISTPLIAHWPNGIHDKRFVHQARHVVDIMATIVEVTGASYPADFDGHGIQGLDGESMAPIFSGSDSDRQQPIYWEHEGNCALRQGDWKLVREYGKDWELYNMKEDRTELTDLRGKDRGLAANMAADFDDWGDRVGLIDWGILEQDPSMDWHKEKKPAE